MKKSTLGGSKVVVGIIMIFAILYLLTRYVSEDALRIISIIIILLFFLSMAIRNKVWFKPYFTSRYNILTSKARYQYSFDFTKDILFDKFIEVLQQAGFSIIQTDKAKGSIFATSGLNWYSWGENIYLDFFEDNSKTQVNICSASIFQIYSWGKNERNFEKIIQEFETSLTI